MHTLSLFVFLLVIGLSGSLAQKIPPSLSQQWSADFVFSYNHPRSPVTKGHIAADYVAVGAKIEAQTGQAEPWDLLVNTSNSVSTGYNWVRSIKRCVVWGPYDPNNVRTLIPWEIPTNATYLGEQYLDEKICDVWQFVWDNFGKINATVWTSNNIVLQIEGDPLDPIFLVRWPFVMTFSSVKTYVDPHVFDVPSFCCE